MNFVFKSSRNRMLALVLSTVSEIGLEPKMHLNLMETHYKKGMYNAQKGDLTVTG